MLELTRLWSTRLEYKEVKSGCEDYMKVSDNLLTPEQVAGLLQVHVLTIYSYIRQGKLDAIRLGRSYRIIPKDLMHFIESNRIKNQQAIRRNIRRAL